MAEDSLAPYRSGSAEPWTAELLAAFVRARKPHILMETGTYLGLTTLRLMQAMESYAGEHASELFTIECDRERYEAATKFLTANQGTSGLTRVTCVEGDALHFMKSERLRGTVDFLFLDDDHTAVHVSQELEVAMELMRPGGIICVHDVIGPFGLGAVVKFFGGIVLDLPRLHAAGGLGVLTK